MVHEEEYKGLVIKIIRDDDPESPRSWGNFGTMVCWHSRHNLGDERPSCSPGEWRLQKAAEFDEGIEARVEKIHDSYYKHQRKLLAQGYDYSSRAIRELAAEERSSVDEAIDAVLDKHCVFLPLYLYDHSGITISTGAFSCPWDSGQVGWIYCTKEDIRRDMVRPQKTRPGEVGLRFKPIVHVFQRDIERARERLNGEVESYDQFLTGDIFGFRIFKREECLVCGETHEEELESCWGFYGEEDCLAEAKSIADCYAEEPVAAQC